MAQTSKSVQIRVLHCSDIHLDTFFLGLNEERSGERRRELRSSFMRLMQYVRDRGIQVVLISGDLFDNRYATNTTAELLIREFSGCPETHFVVAPGRYDCLRDNPVYPSGRLPANVHVFKGGELSSFDFDEYNLTVYGWAFEEENMSSCPLQERTVKDTSRINMVCAYADVGGALDSTLCPVGEGTLKSFGADYYGFGSRHEAGDFVRFNPGMMYCYPGSLESTGFEECGLGGTALLQIDFTRGEQLSMDVKKIAFGHLRFVTERLDVTGVDSANEIIARITRLISDRHFGTNTALRVELVGNIRPEFIPPRNFEFDAFGLYFFDLCDKTMPLYGTEHFVRDMTAAGEVYRTLAPMFGSESEEERLLAAQAFRAALSALGGKE